ncbi:hypothetical protein DFJ63DRAFT_323056 [Scheffersomyces coipomensis]|uniref:uncharacterized protein n=1 Tax=Scheffersomyces coipomensis TaxID=1788519 RepID=UPI00315C6DAF
MIDNDDTSISTAAILDPSASNTKQEYQGSRIPPSELIKYPFKTLNRILDDLKWSIPFKNKYNVSLLNSKPIDYSSDLSRMSNNKQFNHDVLTLNNALTYSPSLEKIEASPMKISIIRGLIVDNRANENIYHFRIIVLESITNPFITNSIDKHEYHIIPKSLLSPDDLNSLKVKPLDEGKVDETIFDDAFYKSYNSPHNQILRVTIFKKEFSKEELLPFVDQDLITKRYSGEVDNHPSLSPDTVPNVIHCFKTLIKVLKGPILLNPDDSIKTISLKNRSLSATIDVNFLLQRLSFSISNDESELVPPNLVLLPDLKESFIRMIQELIFLGRVYSNSVETNEFQTTYSYANNFSLIFGAIPEYDKHMNLTQFLLNCVNEVPYFINLSIMTYFQDEFIIKCFENTVKSDPANKLHYVDSLKSVANYRVGTTKLGTYIKNMTAQGELVGYHDYVDAMKIIGISLSDPSELDEVEDDVVIAMYKSNFEADPKNYQYYNNKLQMIAKVRQSSELWKYINNEVLPLNIALDELTIEEITEDDVVITAYEYKLNELAQSSGFVTTTSEIVFLNKSLLSVAVNRKSYLLLNYVETKLPDIIRIPKEDITYSKALEILGVPSHTSNDFEIITSFQAKLSLNDRNDISSDIRILRYCLKLIAENKKSEILFSFLKNGKIDPTLLPAENWPAGLDNIGNTCYLNSLLQYYFCIKPLRDLILEFDEDLINLDDLNDKRKIGGRKVEDLEIKRSNQFIYHLRYLFDEMIHTQKRCVQPTKELAYLSFLALSQPVDFKDPNAPEIIEIKDDDYDFDNDQIMSNQSPQIPIVVSSESPQPTGDTEMLDADEQKLQPEDDDDEAIEVISIEEPTSFPEYDQMEVVEINKGPKLLSISTDQMESTIEVGRQQDVTECIENVIFQIETALAPQKLDDDGEQIDLIKKLFYGKIKQTITPVKESDPTVATGPSRITLERFFSLIINVSDHPKSIYDTLDNYFNEDLVTLDEGLCKKSITVNELPDILQFHVQRVLFDRERLMAYKSIEPIPFSEKIYFDRYLDTTDEEILRLRSEVFQWKNEIARITEEKEKLVELNPETKLSIIDTLKITKKYLESVILPHKDLSINPTTIIQLENLIEEYSNKLVQYNLRLVELHDKISNQFKNYKKVGYTIFAIFIHRGEASYGHYWIYIKDPHRNNIYRKYNDEMITEVSLSEVFNFEENNTATPYYIVYVKDELEKDYVDPLKRVINKC